MFKFGLGLVSAIWIHSDIELWVVSIHAVKSMGFDYIL